MWRYWTLVIGVVVGVGAACESGGQKQAEAEEPTEQMGSEEGAGGQQGGEAADEETTAMTEERQAKMTPEEAIARLERGNERFVAGEGLDRDLAEQVEATAPAQYPFAAVLGCIDSRVPPEVVFDQGVGDIFTGRVAGNYVNEDMLGSLEFATAVAGSKAIVVLGHTKCGAVQGACDKVDLGNINAIVEEIRPSVEAVTPEGESCSSDNLELVNDIAAHNVQRTIDEIRAKSDVISQLEDEGTVEVVGAMYDVATGEVVFMEEADESEAAQQ